MVNELNAVKRLIIKRFELVIEILMHISGSMIEFIDWFEFEGFWPSVATSVLFLKFHHAKQVR
jgi:hypothetical protein